MWVLLMQFDKSPKSKLTKAIMEDEVLLQSIISLLDVNSSVVKGRIYLYIYFIINSNLKKSITLL